MEDQVDNKTVEEYTPTDYMWIGALLLSVTFGLVALGYNIGSGVYDSVQRSKSNEKRLFIVESSLHEIYRFRKLQKAELSEIKQHVIDQKENK